MAICSSLHLSTTLQALLIFAVLAVLLGDVHGRHHCDTFSCGHLHNISHPFRRQGDPHRCGVQSYELVCTDSKAIIQINTATYFVTEINYTDSSFWVIDANLDMNSSCPLPCWDQLPYFGRIQRSDKHQSWELLPNTQTVGSFVNCSQAVPVTNEFYEYFYTPVPCLSNNHTFVYVVTDTVSIESLEPSCGYLAMFLLSDPGPGKYYNFSHYADFVKHLRLGFSVQFPLLDPPLSITGKINFCLDESFRQQHQELDSGHPSYGLQFLGMHIWCKFK